MDKYYEVEIIQTGTASTIVKARSTLEARKKVNQLLQNEAVTIAITPGWDNQEVGSAMETTDPDAPEFAENNETAYKELMELDN